MNDQEKRNFENLLMQSFINDTSMRELRLSVDELYYLGELMPKAKIREMSDSICPDGKRWYEVSLR